MSTKNVYAAEKKNDVGRIRRELVETLGNLPCGLGVYQVVEDKILPVYHNPSFYSTIGYSPDYIRAVVQKQILQYLAGEENHCETEYRLKKGTDSYIWVKVSLSVILGSEGEKRVYAMYHDITREREEQERMRRQYNDLIIQHYRTPGPNALIVGHCNITQNRILEIIDYTELDPLKRFGTNREVFFTGLSGTITDPLERQEFLDTFLRAPSLAAFQRGETEKLLKCFIKLPQDVTGRYVLFKMYMVSAPDTEDLTGILTVTDITEDTIYDRILHQLSVTGHDFVVDVDLPHDCYTMISCHENAHVVPLKKGCHTKWMDEMLNKRIVPRDREVYRRGLDPGEMAERLEREGSYTFSFSVVDDDGQIYTKNMTVSAVDLKLGRVCLSRIDVTDMLTAERQFQAELEKALKKARKADQAKSEFLSSMSHDIRTPMNAIMGMTALASAHLDDRTRVEEYLQKISVSSRHLLSLINDVLDMSKIDGSKIDLNIQYISLSDLMEQLSAIITPQAQASGLEFAVKSKDITHCYFYGDFLRTNQIFINLLSNAVKFTPEGGRVDLLVEEIPAVKPDAVRYRFTVSDTGVGMSEEFLNHIFDPFVRSENTAQIEGTGLGLSITKGLVDLMGGNIGVRSEAGRGSVFEVVLEYTAAGKNDELLQDTKAVADGKENRSLLIDKRILVAEDNSINAEITCGFLELYGALYVVKTDGRQAVDAFAQAKPGTYDAILMDIQMPRMNGYEATRRIREMDRADAQEIPIIAMTANAFSEDVQSCMDAGMTAHIAKPIDVKALGNTLCRLLMQEVHG